MCSEIVGKRAGLKVPPMEFPAEEMPEDKVLEELWAKLNKNMPPQRNWMVYGPESHPFAKKVFGIPEAIDSYSVEFYRQLYPGIHEMAQESIRMIGSLLGASDPAGFITTGGTEANLMAIRLARNLAKKSKPEFVVPYSRHYTFNLASELFGVKMRLVDVNEDYSPKMEQVESLINENTVALACSAPEGNIGSIDPVKEFSEIAEKKGLYLHVDAAVGGFILPFMRMLGYDVPPFDFGLPAVVSMTADPHKLGLTPRPSGAFILRNSSYLEAIPIEEVVIDTITASGRPGSATAAVWSLIKHLGKKGYTQLAKHMIELTKMLAVGIEEIEGLRLLKEPQCNIIAFTSDKYDLEKIAQRLWVKGWPISVNPLLPYNIKFMKLYVHPLKKKSSAEALLNELENAVKTIKKS